MADARNIRSTPDTPQHELAIDLAATAMNAIATAKAKAPVPPTAVKVSLCAVAQDRTLRSQCAWLGIKNCIAANPTCESIV